MLLSTESVIVGILLLQWVTCHRDLNSVVKVLGKTECYWGPVESTLHPPRSGDITGGPEEQVDCRVAISCELKHSIFRGKLPKKQETLNRKDGAVHGTLTCLLPRKIVQQMVTNKYYRERKSVWGRLRCGHLFVVMVDGKVVYASIWRWMSQGGGRAGVQALRRVCAGHIQGQQRRHSSKRKVGCRPRSGQGGECYGEQDLNSMLSSQWWLMWAGKGRQVVPRTLPRRELL